MSVAFECIFVLFQYIQPFPSQYSPKWYRMWFTSQCGSDFARHRIQSNCSKHSDAHIAQSIWFEMNFFLSQNHYYHIYISIEKYDSTKNGTSKRISPSTQQNYQVKHQFSVISANNLIQLVVSHQINFNLPICGRMRL